MIFKTILLCFSLVLVYGQENSIKLRIVNGEEASTNEAKFVVYVSESYTKDGQLKVGSCGGTLIGDQTVLTAAHCVYNSQTSNPKGQVNIWYGSHNRKIEKFDDIWSENVIIHDGFNPNTLQDDIAIVKLKKKVTLDGRFVSYAKLPKEGQYSYEPGTQVTVYGWGDTTENNSGVYPDNLKKTTLKITSYKDDKGKPFLHARDKDSAICKADSGGPLIIDGTVLLGLLSAGIPNRLEPWLKCKKNTIARFTKIESYLQWIEKNK